MKRFVTQGIVLTRINYAEADRIITFLTSDRGKVKAYARGVRKSKSKLAGGIELFSLTDLTLVAGRGEINTLISSRLVQHYGNIVKDLERTKVAYEFLRIMDKATEDQPEPAYFELLDQGLGALNDLGLNPKLTNLWFDTQLLKLTGHMPNLHSDLSGAKLTGAKSYTINLDKMHFESRPKGSGTFTPNHIKFLRLSFGASRPQTLHRVDGAELLVDMCQPLIQAMLKSHLRV